MGKQARKQADKQAGKQADKQAGKHALGRHSVGAMPWRVLFGLKDVIILNGNKPRYKKLLLFKIFSVFCQQQYFFLQRKSFLFHEEN